MQKVFGNKCAGARRGRTRTEDKSRGQWLRKLKLRKRYVGRTSDWSLGSQYLHCTCTFGALCFAKEGDSARTRDTRGYCYQGSNHIRHVEGTNRAWCTSMWEGSLIHCTSFNNHCARSTAGWRTATQRSRACYTLETNASTQSSEEKRVWVLKGECAEWLEVYNSRRHNMSLSVRMHQLTWCPCV